MRSELLTWVLLSLLSFPGVVLAEEPVSHPLENTGPWFLAAEAGGGVLLTVGARLFVGPPDAECQWCDSNAFDRAGRNLFVVESASKEIGYISHGVTVGLVPALGLFGVIAPALDAGEGGHAVENAVLMVNAFLYTTAVAELAKGLADRQRPGVYYGRAAETQAGDFVSERNRSFFSADTAWAFSLASSASTVAYLRGYSWAPYVTAGTFGLAAVGGSMRIMSDMHWPTDVLTGAVVGTAIGFVVPYVLHSRSETSATIRPEISGDTTMFQLQWSVQ